jgi:TetR/AcrR family transcriptional regulator, mexJK operon transcriptional repressor
LEQLLESGPFKRGRGGRPNREEAERRHLGLLETARRLLLAKGWDGASIDEISRQSGVAKRFIYARYPDKAALFVGAILHYRLNQIGDIHLPDPLPADVEDGLLVFGQSLLDLALTDESLAIFRLFVAEAHRFRNQIKLLLAREDDNDPLKVASRVLRAYAEQGALELSDPRLAAEQFCVLVVSVPQRLALVIGREPPDREASRLRAAIQLFLDGCRAKRVPDSTAPIES